MKRFKRAQGIAHKLVELANVFMDKDTTAEVMYYIREWDIEDDEKVVISHIVEHLQDHYEEKIRPISSEIEDD